MKTPADEEPVAADHAVCGAILIHAVHVPYVLDDFHAEPLKIEMRVACHERIVRPIHHVDTLAQEGTPLELLQLAAESKVPALLPYGQHVGPMAGFSVAPS